MGLSARRYRNYRKFLTYNHDLQLGTEFSLLSKAVVSRVVPNLMPFLVMDTEVFFSYPS